jgi:hypothetical protein
MREALKKIRLSRRSTSLIELCARQREDHFDGVRHLRARASSMDGEKVQSPRFRGKRRS